MGRVPESKIGNRADTLLDGRGSQFFRMHANWELFDYDKVIEVDTAK